MAFLMPGRARARAASVAAVGLGALLLGACASSAAPAGTSPALTVGTTVFPAPAAPRVPVVAGNLVGGGRLSLAADRGHVVVLNFWASWCTVCRQESPVLSAAARHFQGSAVRFVGVDVGDDAASAAAFMRNFRMTYPSLSDPGDAIPLRFSSLVPVLALPYTLVISAQGRVRGRVIGAVSARGLVRLIAVAGAGHNPR